MGVVDDSQRCAADADWAIDRATGPDRRRPGRAEHVSEHLLPLLRDPTRSATPYPGLDMPGDPPAVLPLIGVAWGIGLSVPLWLSLVSIIWTIIG